MSGSAVEHASRTPAGEPVLGSGDWRFTPDPGWPSLDGQIELGDVAGLAIDGEDRIVLFNRGAVPVVVVDPAGRVLHAWGEGEFANPHGASFGPDGSLYLTDNGLHVVRKYELTGTLLLEIGRPGRPSEFMSNEPFNRCTHAVEAPGGDIYVSDGYHNACVHRFSANGELLSTWGEPGARPGQFNLPHNIACDSEGRIYVADRENGRVQVFDSDGSYLSQVVNLHRPSGMALVDGDDPVLLVGELGAYLEVNRRTPNLGPQLTVVGLDSQVRSSLSLDGKAGQLPGQFLSPHSIALDSHGALYVGEVGRADWDALFPGEPMPERLRGVQKFNRA